MALTSAVQRFYYVYKDDPKKLQGFYSTIILFVLVNSLFLGSLVILFKDFLVEPFIEGIDFYPYMLFGILTVMVNPIYNIYQSLLQTMQGAKSFAINSSLNFILLVSLNIFLIIVMELGAIGQLLATLITALVFALYSFYSLYKEKIITFTFNFNYLKEALSYSLPLLPHLL